MSSPAGGNEMIAWAAGFLEGEGSFVPRIRHKGRVYFTITAVQVNPEPLERLQQLFGGSLRPEPKRGNRQDQVRWCLCGARAKEALALLWPYLSEKRRSQAQEAGAFEVRRFHRQRVSGGTIV